MKLLPAVAWLVVTCASTGLLAEPILIPNGDRSPTLILPGSAQKAGSYNVLSTTLEKHARLKCSLFSEMFTQSSGRFVI